LKEFLEARCARVDYLFKEVRKGTGLGLSISYQTITEKHNDKLYYDSIVGGGTQFWIEIPV
jgi:signal transduction histidine kinase